jgi:hypothetical protein
MGFLLRLAGCFVDRVRTSSWDLRLAVVRSRLPEWPPMRTVATLGGRSHLRMVDELGIRAAGLTGIPALDAALSERANRRTF